eukprot:gnl/Chilomastix_cuspidata/4692.p1 GENE.gnl/Chilomastix_cuspidata/4692~~gnl/Chilomastix_cuspidata/4692.p1  ORF type:complete len:400 (+),score=109.12 gnl/Chilomastix_cuspidata/4692:149-1348(+)
MGCCSSGATRCEVSVHEEAAGKVSAQLLAESSQAKFPMEIILSLKNTRLLCDILEVISDKDAEAFNAICEDPTLIIPELKRFIETEEPEFCGCSHSISEFAAFRGARALDFVHAKLSVAVQEFLGLSVTVRSPSSDSLEAPALRIAGPGEFQRAALSTAGDLSLMVKGSPNELRLYSFVSGQQRTIQARALCWSCVFEDKLFVGINCKSYVLHAPVADVYAGRPLGEFDRLEVPGKVGEAATDRAPDGEIVILIDSTYGSRVLLRLDLRTGAAARVECDMVFGSIGPLSGVRVPGALCAASEDRHRGNTVVVFEDGHTATVASGLCDGVTLLPSASAPSDLSKAAVIDWEGTVSYQGRQQRLETPVRPYYQTLVRVYRDVFLCCNEVTGRWAALRIAVP